VQICSNCGEENPPRFRLCGFCGAALALELPPQETRKTVTIVFSDLKGSTSLGEALDAESLREVMTQYFDAMKAELERHGGTIEKYIGDAVMAVFGLPKLHEDDAIRAVRAAAGMQSALAELNEQLQHRWGVQLVNRTGVNTGEVVAGDATTGQRLVTGDAVNVAARLEQAAGACEVLLGESTYRLVRHAVRVEDVEPLELKGKSERVPAFRLLEVADAEAIARRSDSPLVGRTNELDLLRSELDDVEARDVCRLVTIVGEAGLGKSRLTQEFLQEVDGRATVLRGRCLPYGRGITFWPLVEIVREAAGISEEDGPDQAREKVLAAAAGAEDVVERVAAAIGIGERQFSVHELFWGARKFLETMARERPVVLVFEDIHWAEPTLLDLIEHLNASVLDAAMLVLCGARPMLLETRPTWSQAATATLLELHPLSDEESGVVLANLLGDTGLPDVVRARVVAAAEGNPLYAEQMLAMLIEEGQLRSTEGGGWTAADDLAELVVPPTISALLTARLDLLSREERSVIEPASVIGLVFPRDAVGELAPEPVGSAIDAHLGSLEVKRLVRTEAESDDEHLFRFHHILIKDAAYGGLLKRARATFHERFVDWAERVNRDRDRELEFEEIHGYHLEQAFKYLSELGPLDDRGRQLGVRGFERLASAGRRAFARGDMPAAANLLRRATELVEENDPRRLALLPDLSEAMLEIGELAWAEVYVDQAAEAARASGNRVLESHATIGRLLVQRHSGHDEGWSERVLSEADSVIAAFGEVEDHAGLAKAYRLLCYVHVTACRLAAFQQAAEQAGMHAGLAGDRRRETQSLTNHATAAVYGPTPVPDAILRCREILELAAGDRRTTGIVTCLLAEALAQNGEFDEARRLVVEGRAILEDLGRGIIAPSTALQGGPIELLADNPEASERKLREAYEELDRIGERYFAPSIAALLGNALYALERDDEAEAFARIAAERTAEDDVATQAYWRVALARVLARRDSDAGALELALEAVELLRPTDGLVWRADALAALGDVLDWLGHVADAAEARSEALRLYEAKRAIAAAARVRAAISAGTDLPAPAENY
jgi:class 3 adenylate cyclase